MTADTREDGRGPERREESRRCSQEWLRHSVLLLVPFALWGQTAVDTVRIAPKPASRKLSLPGEFTPYLSVEVNARVTGFVDRVLVDRGSVVKKDELLATVVAPEMKAQRAEAEARVEAAQAQRAEAAAKLAGLESTYARMKEAAATPGAIAGNELDAAAKSVDAARAQVSAVEGSIRAAQAAVKAIADLEEYLNVTAPFAGIITERNVHPGALVGPGGSRSQGALFHLDQLSKLRLVVAVPEVDVAGIPVGAHTTFTVPAFPGRTFNATVARVARSMDARTRTMAIELDVANPHGELAPGMYPTVEWQVKNARAAIVVPATAVVTTTERNFVIRIRDGAAEWVTVTKGPAAGPDNVEVRGPLAAGDVIVKRASDEIRPGTKLTAK